MLQTNAHEILSIQSQHESELQQKQEDSTATYSITLSARCELHVHLT